MKKVLLSQLIMICWFVANGQTRTVIPTAGGTVAGTTVTTSSTGGNNSSCTGQTRPLGSSTAGAQTASWTANFTAGTKVQYVDIVIDGIDGSASLKDSISFTVNGVAYTPYMADTICTSTTCATSSLFGACYAASTGGIAVNGNWIKASTTTTGRLIYRISAAAISSITVNYSGNGTGVGLGAFIVTNVAPNPKTENGNTSTLNGGIAIANVASNDSISGTRASLGVNGNSTIAQSGSWPSGITLNTSTGAVSVVAGKAIGSYPIAYSLCDKSLPTPICNTITDTVIVKGCSDATKMDDYCDFDGDGVINSIDIDDDNDGVIDAVEAPNCYYTAAEAAAITAVSTKLTLNTGAVTNVIDGNSTTYSLFNTGQNWIGQDLYNVTATNPVPISGMSFDILTGYPISTSASNTVKLQGSNDNATWVDLSPASAYTATSGTVTISNTLDPNTAYKYYKVVGVAGTSGFGGAYEIHLLPSATYVPSLNPKPACTVNTDGDAFPNQFDLDSDNDGCSDAREANVQGVFSANGSLSNANTQSPYGGNGFSDALQSLSDTNTYKGVYSYQNAILSTVLACTDTDGDGVVDNYDLDDDNDGVLDKVECPLAFNNLVVDGGASASNEPLTNWYRSDLASFWSTKSGSVYNYAVGTCNTCAVNSPLTGGLYDQLNGSNANPNTGMLSILNELDGSGVGIVYNFNTVLPPCKLNYSYDLANRFSGAGTPNDYYKVSLYDLTQHKQIAVLDSINSPLVPTGTNASPQFKNFSGSITIPPTGSGNYAIIIQIDYNNTGQNSDFMIDRFAVTYSDATACACPDTDGDGIPDYKDLDSDNDGCSDAKEAGVTNLATTTAAPAGMGATTGLANSVAPAPYSSNGFSDILQSTADTNAYKGIYTYSNAIGKNYNACSDVDGDGINDVIDIDADNDGILDAVEAPSCYYTAAEANVISTITTGLANDSYTPSATDLPLLHDGLTTPVVTINTAVANVTGVNIATVTYPTPVKLDTLKVNIGTAFTGSPVARLQGSNDGVNWYYVSAPVTMSTTGNQNFKDTSNIAYTYYRVFGTGGAISNTTGTITEISSVLGANYSPSLNPKPTCSEDADGDGITNDKDLDSDGDGCSDAKEAGVTNLATTTAAPAGMGATTGLANSVAPSPYGGNGFSDVLQSPSDTNAYKGAYVYKYAIDNTINACTDTDGDGIADIYDLDDDNDGILDKNEQNICTTGPFNPSMPFQSPIQADVYSDYTISSNATSPSVASILSNKQGTVSVPSESGAGTAVFNSNGIAPYQNALYTSSIQGTSTTNTISTEWSNDGYNLVSLTPGTTSSSSGYLNLSSDPTYAIDYKIPITKDGNVIWHFQTGNAWVISDDDEFVVEKPDGTKIRYSSNHNYGTAGNTNLLGPSAAAGSYSPVIPVSAGDIVHIVVFETIGSYTGINGELTFCGADLDTDGDGIPNSRDLDSDGDGCSDAKEAGVTNFATTTAAPAGMGATTGLANSVAPAPYNGNGFSDILQSSTDTNAYKAYYTYQYATSKWYNACSDVDGDGINDIADIDADNDGILDAVECPSCYYTATEANTISTITSNLSNNTYSTTATDMPILHDGSTAAAVTFNTATALTGVNIATVTYPTPVKLDTLKVNVGATFGASSTAKLQGSKDGFTWFDLTGNVTLAAGVDNFKVTSNANNYMYYRILGTGGTSATTATITEISSTLVANYSASLNPKTTCAEDTDGDGITNDKDLDSDGDGCSDAKEASVNQYATLTAAPAGMGATTGLANSVAPSPYNGNGFSDILQATADTNTFKGTYTYANAITNYSALSCIDSDGDGIPDNIDLDDDNDGILDTQEGCYDTQFSGDNANMTNPSVGIQTMFSFGSSSVGTRSPDNNINFVQIANTGASTTITNNNVRAVYPASGGGSLKIDSVVSNTLAEAKANGEYLEFSFTTNSTIKNGTIDWVGFYNSISQPGFSTTYSISSNGGATFADLGSRTLANASGGGTYPAGRVNIDVPDYALAPNTTYKVRVYLYGFGGNSTTITLDDFYLGFDACTLDTDGDGISNEMDLDSDGDRCSDAKEAGVANITSTSTGTLGMGATGTGLNNAVAPAPYSGNGFSNILQSAADTNAYKATYTYWNATSTFLNACADTDNDGIPDLVDLDDDNDGIIDAIEVPSCYYTQSEMAIPSAVSSSLTYSAGNNTNLIDNNTGTTTTFTNAQNTNGKTIFTVTPIMPAKIDTLGFEMNGTTSFLSATASSVQVQGWNGTAWINVTDTITPPAQSPASAGGYVNIPLTKNKSNYFQYRLVGTSASGTVAANAIRDIKLKTNSTYVSSAYPKPSCTTDKDGDGITNDKDLDSDGDGCSDAFEAGVSAQAGVTTTNAPIGMGAITGTSKAVVSGPYSGNGFADILQSVADTNAYKYTYTYANAIDTTIRTCCATITNDSIYNNQTICNGFAVDTIRGTIPTFAPSKTILYQWMSSISSDTSGFTNITGATLRYYFSGSLSVTTYYKRIAYSAGCAGDTTKVVTITVNAKPNAGTDQTICKAGTATMNALGSGSWSLGAASAGTATITDSTLASTTVDNFSIVGTYYMIWTNSNGCKDTAIITAKVCTDTVIVRPACPTCPVVACVTKDDITTTASTTYSSCGLDGSETTKGNYVIDMNGCLIWQGNSSFTTDSITTCMVACNGSICDTTIIIIRHPIPPYGKDTVVIPTIAPGRPTAALCGTGDDIPIGYTNLTRTNCGLTGSASSYGTLTTDTGGCIIWTPNNTHTTDTIKTCVKICADTIISGNTFTTCDTTIYLILPPPIKDTVTVTPSCKMCPVTVCPTVDDITIYNTTTYSSCGTPSGYSQTGSNANGCYTYTRTGYVDYTSTTCIVACNGSICDTTIIIINKVIEKDTITANQPCDTCAMEVCTTGDDLDNTSASVNTSMPCGTPSGYTITGPDGSGCYRYKPSISAAEYSYTCQISCKNGKCDTTVVVLHRMSTILPITLLDFTAKLTPENTTKLAWTTASEINNEKFEIEHSTNAIIWEKIGEVAGAGYSTSLLYYQYFHNNPVNGENYYRLKQTDYNGNFTYSPIRSVKIDLPFDVLLKPNPANQKVDIIINTATNDAPVNIYIIDLQGRIVAAYDNTALNNNRLAIDVSKYEAALYFVKVIIADTKQNFKLQVIH